MIDSFSPLRTCLVFLWGAVAAVGCAETKSLDNEFSEPRAVDGSATSSGALTSFYLKPNSSIEFTLGNKVNRVQGSVPVSGATIALDLDNLSRSQVSFWFDVSAIAVNPSPSTPTPEGQYNLTEQAQQWLQTSSRPTGSTLHNRVDFRVRLLGNRGPYAAGQSRRPELRKSGNRRRIVDLLVTGDLSLHGFRVEHTLPVRAVFQYENAAKSNSPPISVKLQSRSPITLPLRQYGVIPRNAEGDILASEAARLAKSAFHTARLSFRWTATPSNPTLK